MEYIEPFAANVVGLLLGFALVSVYVVFLE